MLLKKNKADKKTIEKIFKVGKTINSSLFVFKFILNKSSLQSHFSFIVPKNIVKLAVKRNLLKRKGYFALEKNIKQFPFGIWCVFIFKKKEENILKIEHEIKNILNKIN